MREYLSFNTRGNFHLKSKVGMGFLECYECMWGLGCVACSNCTMILLFCVPKKKEKKRMYVGTLKDEPFIINITFLTPKICCVF